MNRDKMNEIQKLKFELKDLPEDYITLIETSPEKAFEVSTITVKLLSKNNRSGIIISANRPYSNLLNIYKKNDINPKKLFILDCISKNLNGHNHKSKNVVFIENLSSLTDISLSLSEQIDKMNGNRFIFFDSITTMLIHNKPYVFARFVHSILTKMRLNGVGGVLITLQDKTSREIRAEIAQLCDKVIVI
jgi:hypothetical protein